MNIDALGIPDVLVLQSKRFGDDRGYFSETYNQTRFQDLTGTDVEFVQDNQSLSRDVGTLRGLHFQTPPHAQAKLVRVLRGAIWDVAVDIRRSSPTFGKWVGAKLTAEMGNQLFVPVGFAHGFITLEPDTEVFYKVSDYYAPDCDKGLIWNDPRIGVNWPIAPTMLSPKDQAQPLLADLPEYF